MSFKNPLTVCYLPTNSSKPSDLGSYYLEDNRYLFDIGILFAANINGTSDKPKLYINESVTAALNSGIVKTLQDKGMKVTVSILGNHQEAGISNLTNNGVTSFANQLVDLVNKYHLDGLDFDDEYSHGPPNQSSFPLLISNLRTHLPDKLLTFYFIGGAASSLEYKGINVGTLLNYAWNPYYSSFSAPGIPGMSNSQLGPAAVNLNPSARTYTPQELADSYATQTLSGGYGVYLLWDLLNKDYSAYLSSVSQILYKQSTSYRP